MEVKATFYGVTYEIRFVTVIHGNRRMEREEAYVNGARKPKKVMLAVLKEIGKSFKDLV